MIPVTQQKDLAHRLQEWVMENRTFLILILIGGIGFFGLLAGIHFWHQKQSQGTRAGLFAMIDSAHQAREQKDWAGCVSEFEKIYQQSNRQPFFRALALHGQGSCLQGSGEFLQAAQRFERAAKEPGHVEPLASLFEAARCYQMTGQPQGEERLEALLKEEKLSPELKEKILEELLWYRLRKDS